MPEVGGRHFSYSKQGKAKAKAFAKRTGKTIKHARSKPSGSGRRAVVIRRKKRRTS